MRVLLLLAVLAACTDDGGGGGGDDTTSHVEMLVVTPGTPGCFVGTPFDADATTAGPQYDCSVTKTAGGNVIAQCNAAMTNQPCWTIGTNASCTSTHHSELQIVPSVTEGITAQCLVQ
ncbi:MAG TPA: hypothetical protein VL326_18105 [Kofleriaceae bacterium]|jgi:hypothetical protein|nr:hypothetical protein [Kofleriaceae bacterium]